MKKPEKFYTLAEGIAYFEEKRKNEPERPMWFVVQGIRSKIKITFEYISDESLNEVLKKYERL